MGAIVTDQSTDGFVPDPSSDNDPTNDTVGTSIIFDEHPLIGLSQEIVSVFETSQNVYQITIAYTLENLGDIVLDNLELFLDTSSFFVGAVASWPVTINDGSLV
ncbi:MAG: hypothetical protein H6765_03395 [Candidatus Peribacteria bacterium]|nr:MAG: hypothetical protein H6765_03395 [Candidatus Peribacteria bacterium]